MQNILNQIIKINIYTLVAHHINHIFESTIQSFSSSIKIGYFFVDFEPCFYINGVKMESSKVGIDNYCSITL